MQTLEEVNKVDWGGAPVALPNLDLFIIVNSKSKSNQIVWQSLINVGSLGALRKLREINWPYANIDENSLDDASRQIIESVSAHCCKRLVVRMLPRISRTKSGGLTRRSPASPMLTSTSLQISRKML